MKYKTIMAWHEARMTFVQVVIPTITAGIIIDGRYPDLKYKARDAIRNKINDWKNFCKKESE